MVYLQFTLLIRVNRCKYLFWKPPVHRGHLCCEEGMRLQALRLDHQLHDAVQVAVVQHGPLPARKEIRDDALEERQVHLQELGEVNILHGRVMGYI